MSVAGQQARHRAHPAPHRGDAPTPRGSRYHRDRLWLGHEQITTTNIYLHADMTMKEDAIAKIAPQNVVAGRYQPPDAVLVFLASL